jgi:hypothetical protein
MSCPRVIFAFVVSRSSTIEYVGAFCVIYGCCGVRAFFFFFCRGPSLTSLPFPERNLLAMGCVVSLLMDPEPSAAVALLSLVFNEGFVSHARSPSGGAFSSLNAAPLPRQLRLAVRFFSLESQMHYCLRQVVFDLRIGSY